MYELKKQVSLENEINWFTQKLITDAGSIHLAHLCNEKG